MLKAVMHNVVVTIGDSFGIFSNASKYIAIYTVSCVLAYTR